MPNPQHDLETLLSSRDKINPEKLETLRQQGADIYALDAEGQPLFWKLKNWPHEVQFLQLLKEGKIECDVKNKQGYNLLEHMLQEGVRHSRLFDNIEIIECLLQILPIEVLSHPVLCEDSFHKDKMIVRSIPDLLLSKKSYDLIDLIHARGVSLPLPFKKREDFDSVTDYFEALAGSTQFYLAYKQNPDIVKLRGKHNETILFHMIRSGRDAFCNLDYMLKKNPQLLLDSDQNNDTPVHLATVSCQEKDMCQMIFPRLIVPALQRLPEFNYAQLNNSGQSPLHFLARVSYVRWPFPPSNLLPNFLYTVRGCSFEIATTRPEISDPSNKSRTAIFYLDKEKKSPEWNCYLVDQGKVTVITFDRGDEASLALNHLAGLESYQQIRKIETQYGYTLFRAIAAYTNILDIDLNVLSSSGSTPFFYAINHNNLDAAYSLLAYGANPLLSGSPDRDPINMIDASLVELRHALVQPENNQMKEQIEDQIVALNDLRQAATLGYAENMMAEGNREQAILACKRIHKKDPGFAQAQYLLAEMLLDQAMDQPLSAKQKANLHYLVLPYYINAAVKDPDLMVRRDRCLRKMYNLSDDTPAEQLQLFVDLFKKETKAAEIIQRAFRKSRKISEFDGELIPSTETHSVVSLPYVSDLEVISSKLSGLYGDVSSLSDKQIVLLSNRLTAIILDAVKQHNVVNEKIALDLLVGLYDGVSNLNPKKAQNIMEQVTGIIETLAAQGSSEASVLAISIYTNAGKDDQEELIKKHLMRLVDSRDLEKKLTALRALDETYQVKIPFEMSSDLLNFLSHKIMESIREQEEYWVKWAITFFKLDPNSIVDEKSNYSLMRAAAHNASVDMIQFLVEKGGDLNLKSGGLTPVEQAIYAGNLANVAFLLKLGAKIDTSSTSLLEKAISQGTHVYNSSFQDRFQIVKLLIDQGAPISKGALEKAELLQSSFHNWVVPEEVATGYIPLLQTALEQQNAKKLSQKESSPSVTMANQTLFTPNKLLEDVLPPENKKVAENEHQP